VWLQILWCIVHNRFTHLAHPDQPVAVELEAAHPDQPVAVDSEMEGPDIAKVIPLWEMVTDDAASAAKSAPFGPEFWLGVERHFENIANLTIELPNASDAVPVARASKRARRHSAQNHGDEGERLASGSSG
jgi:hypothetical protein